MKISVGGIRFVVRFIVVGILSGALLSGMVACTKEERIVERQAPPEIAQSFSISGNSLKIQKSSLNKRFLLMSSGTTGGPTPQWLDVKPQVVTFTLDQSGKKLALNEENYSVVYDEIQSVHLLTTFDIVAQDADSITFEWGKGLTSLTLEDVFAVDVKDPEEADGGDEDAKQVIPVIDSYVKSLSFDPANNLEINQVSKVRTNEIKSTNGKVDFQTREQTLVMNLQIRPYLPREGFTAKAADAKRRVGFFVTKLKQKEKSNTDINLITRWDLDPSKGPITFLISESVPPQYVQAVSDGALYWNKVFGREVVVVQTGVSKLTTPKNRSILVHWVPWLDAGAAYAQAQSDPLTGEILRGQIFMPSAFIQIGSAQQLNLNGGNPVRKNLLSPVLNKTTACDFSQTLASVGQMATAAATGETPEVADSQRLRLAQDSVRSTVAHEAGHALGLRHNFAGSFSAKVSTEAIYSAAQTYLKDLNHPGLQTSTSIMDYVTGVDEVLMSAYIKHDGLDYDKMAMAWAYDDGNISVSESVSRYCSDEDIGLANAKKLAIYGCERFDAGNNPLYRKFLDARDSQNDFVKTLFVSILNRLYPYNKAERTELASVLEGTKPFIQKQNDTLDFVSQLLLEDSKDGKVTPHFVSFENAKAHVGTAYAESDPYLDAKISNDLKEAGGYANLLNTLLRNSSGAVETNWYGKQIEQLIAAPYFSQGVTLSGRPYVLSKDEQSQIVHFFESYRDANAGVAVAGAAKLIPSGDEHSSSALKKALLQDGEATTLAVLVKDLELASVGTEKAQVGAGLATTVELPVKFIEAADMGVIAGLLSPKLLNVADNAANKLLVEQSVRAQLNKVILTADSSLLPPEKEQTATKDEYKAIFDRLKANNTADTKALTFLTKELVVGSFLF